MRTYKLIVAFSEAFMTVWVTGITAVVGATYAAPPRLAWLIITAPAILAGFRRVNALLTSTEGNGTK